MKKILIVVGTRPNFIKITQFKKAALQYGGLELKIVHTGQHQTDNMSKIFFEQLKIELDYHLNVSSFSPLQILSNTMLELEKLITNTCRPNLLLVVGDVTTTLAGALTANKMNIKLGHVESGLRSFDREMPEEFNRILTDAMADYLFVTEQSGIDNLKREGRKEESIFFVGNTMIDTLVSFQDEIERNPVLEKLKLQSKEYILLTMHRPAIVDKKKGLVKLIQLLDLLTQKYKVVFPVHPRTMNRLKFYQLENSFLSNKNLLLLEPLDYFSFQKLIVHSKVIVTDSGGIQEESTYYKIPCLTLRASTERPSTVILGSNEVLPFDAEIISRKISAMESNKFRKFQVPPLWDGKATERIIKIIAESV